MHEFSLFDVSSDWVLCRLKKNFVTDDQKGCEITKRISWKNRKIVNSDGECDKRLMIADVAIAEQPALSDFSFNGASVLVVAEQGNANTAGADFNSEMVPSDNGLQAETIVAEGEVLPEVNSNEGDQLLGHEIVEWAHNSSSMINTDLTFSNGEQSGDDQSFYADLESLNQSDSFLAYLLEDDDMPSKFGSR
ncbi:conserved hypothetical protein [Ricinus communis]|uniref:Uncharacterized protein n=1 Tax=Ricinus communis TaxID=3988 RepID=B9SUU1_RICCO|nr:conserved hypothetical protein [Ricinus communis]